MRRHLAYLRYFLRHKWYVLRASRMVGASLHLALVHDLSKLRPDEWMPYAKTFYAADGSKRYEPSEAFRDAWNHHQKRNRHHWQYWLITWDHGGQEPMPMPERYIREMVADWVGAGWVIRGKIDVWGWYAKNRFRMRLHPHTRGRVLEILESLRLKLHRPVYPGNGPTEDDKMRESIAQSGEEILLADGFDEAVIGVFTRCGQPPVAAYSYERCVEILMADGMTEEEAEEHMGFNVEGAWVGDQTPAFVHDVEGDT